MSKQTYTSNMSNPTDTKFVLRRTNMITAFTDDEYYMCRSKMSEGHSVSVQYAAGGSLYEAQLIAARTDASLVFSICGNGTIVTHTIAPGATHTITTDVYSYQ